MFVPELSHLVNVLIFPNNGNRPHPNELSGGDLDGDIYSLIYDHRLIPKFNESPMSYDAPRQPHQTEKVTCEQIQDFFVNYMKNDNLGLIANTHVALADLHPNGARSNECIQLAKLHSTAVDFCKTGVPAIIPRGLFPSKYPDFMENSFKTSYVSDKILGKLYRKAKQYSFPESEEKQYHMDIDLIIPGSEKYLEEAEELSHCYNHELWIIMNRFDIHDEGQIISNKVLEFSKKHSKSRQKGKNIDRHLLKHVSDLQKTYREEFWKEFEEETDPFEIFQKASAWYQVSYVELEQHRDAFLSFPWVVYEILCRIKLMQKC